MARARVVVRTLLAVGEGKAEVDFLEHVKALYVERGSGLSVKVKGGYGKGGKGVLDYAIAQLSQADFDLRIVLLDTDVDWDDKQRRRAQEQGIDVVESSPCLEAWLLAIHGDSGERSSAGHKAEFKRRFDGPAHGRALLARHFGRATLDKARTCVPELRRLLTLMSC
jgi:hypothetical protein